MDCICDLRILPYADNVVDKILANDILEHFPWAEVEDVLREWCRVLKKGGVLVIKTPNLATLANHLIGPITLTWSSSALEQPPAAVKTIVRKVFGGQDYEGNFHKSGFTPNYLMFLLERAGFKEVHITERMDGGDWSNMGVRAVK